MRPHVSGVETTCSSRGLILALEAAGGLSTVILAHTDEQERLVGIPSSEGRRETASREGGEHRTVRRERAEGSVRGPLSLRTKAYLLQHGTSNPWTLFATLVVLWSGSVLLSGWLHFISSR